MANSLTVGPRLDTSGNPSSETPHSLDTGDTETCMTEGWAAPNTSVVPADDLESHVSQRRATEDIFRADLPA